MVGPNPSKVDIKSVFSRADVVFIVLENVFLKREKITYFL